MNKKIITGFLMFALAVFSMSSFVACKDYDEDSYDDLKARINKEITLREAIEKQIAELEKRLNDIKSCTCDPSKYASQTEFEKALKRIADLEEAIKNIKSCTCDPSQGGGDTTIYITNPYDDEWIKIKFNEIDDQLKILNSLNAWQIYIENRIDSIANAIYGWDTTIYNLNYKVDSILKWLEIHTDTIYISGGGCDPDCKKKIAKAQETANDALYLAQQALLLAMENAGRLNDHEIRISALENTVKDLASKGELKEEIKKLNDRIDDILNKMVTSVIIQGTECPVIGYFNTPLDIRSQLLAAYYGSVDNMVKFPSTKTADYVDASEFWTERNVEVMGMNPGNAEGKSTLDGTFVSQKDGSEEGNAGTLYLTVNPAEVDYDGQTVSLESSTGEAAGIDLSPLQRSDRELSFGYTRAANNGFYQAYATLTADNIDKAKVRIDFKDLEDEAKAMLKEKTKNSVLSFGAALMSSMKDIMPAYAIKTTWTAPSRTDAVGQQTYSVYSQYGLGAAAVKPFSYAFLKDLNVNLPGEQKLIDLVNKLIDKIKIQINLNLPDFSKYQDVIKFQDIDLSGLKDGSGKIVVKFQYSLKDEDGNIKYYLTTTYDGRFEWVGVDGDKIVLYDENKNIVTADGKQVDFTEATIDKDIDLTNIIESVVNQINNQFGENSNLADLVNDVIAIGDLDAKINDAITDAKNDLKTQLQGYVTKAYNKLNNFFSKTPNKALQPILIAKDGKKIGILSKVKSKPTKVNSTSLELVPTSYTLELFAPAYKKFIAVTDVWDASGNPAAASIGKAANGENMLKVIDSEKTCTMNGQAGYTYEVAYSAVDYHGKVVIKRFYVKF